MRFDFKRSMFYNTAFEQGLFLDVGSIPVIFMLQTSALYVLLPYNDCHVVSTNVQDPQILFVLCC
jgi:hypothetical protein